MKKTQLLIIHGGMTFKNHADYMRWLQGREVSKKWENWAGEYLEKKLGRNFEVIRPRMPLQENARYEEWKIHFKKYLPFLQKNAIIMGNSLGGIFLAKYLSENRLPKKALSVYLVCAPFDNTIAGEDLVGGFTLGRDLSLLEKNCQNLYLLFSKDDETVPVAHAEKFRAKLKSAKISIYKSKGGHFQVPTFPEIIKMIKADVKKV